MRRSDFLRTMLAVVSVPPAAVLAGSTMEAHDLREYLAKPEGWEAWEGMPYSVCIQIDGIDLPNPRHQALIREAEETLRRRIGA